MDLDYYWDDAGDPRARPAAAPAASGGSGRGPVGAAAVVARYLESDVQSSAGQAREILRTIDRILAGRLQSWSDTGNAHTLTLSARGAVIAAELDDAAKPARLPLEALRQAVAGWLAFLERGRRAAPAPR
jgi:hypothetical protein